MDMRYFGSLPNGKKIYAFTISDGTAKADIITYGASIRSFKPFGTTDVIGGFDSLEDYMTDTSNQGAIVGRVANRIEGASIEIEGKVYPLVNNDNGNCLHGGVGFQHRAWSVDYFSSDTLALSYYSPDGEDGFPGALTVRVKYTVKDSAIHIEYDAIPEETTAIALTNHAFFNFDGFGGDIRKHKLQIFAERYTEVNENLIPNGNRPFVDGTDIDFRKMRYIDNENGEFKGYDNNMILSPTSYKLFDEQKLGLVAIAGNDKLSMNVYTDQPGMQLYTGYFLGNGPDFKGGIPQIQYGGFCLETQTEPNCVKHGEGIYHPGEKYRHYTVYEFHKK